MKGKAFEDETPCKALLWTDGVPTELPWPDLNYRDEEPWYGGMARGHLANGEIIYGTSWENWDFGMSIGRIGRTAARRNTSERMCMCGRSRRHWTARGSNTITIVRTA